jgi:hypothetical protein
MHTTIIRGSHGSRRAFFRQATGAGATLGAGLLYDRAAHAEDEDEGGENSQPNPIPGGVAPFAPFAIFVHHNPLNPANPLSMLNDPSHITDFNGFVGLTRIRGQGTGTDTKTNAMTTLAYQADMGFSQGEFIGADGHKHQGTFAFV